VLKLSEIVDRKFTETFDVSDWEVETDSGFVDVLSTNKTIEYDLWEIELANGCSIECADTHILIQEDGQEVYAYQSMHNKIQTRFGTSTVVRVKKTDRREQMYDLSVDSDDHVYYTNDILSHNTTTAAGYILWYAVFQQDRTVAVLANKAAQAREIVRRISGMFESIPWFLQPGVSTYNKGSLGYANGSQVISAASSNSSIRGTSISLLYLDEFAFIAREQEFYESTYPVITSGKETKVMITSTPKGARGLFHNLWKGSVAGSNEFVHKLVTWREIPGRDEEWAKETRANMTESQWMQEFECAFLGSQNTLIPYSILSTILTEEPIDGLTDNEHLDIYEEPREGGKYFTTVDVARGFGGDSSAFLVFDVSQIPFRTVAKYKNNQISTLLFPSVIYNTALHYNEAEILVEINDAGGEVANKIYYDYEYENVLMTSKSGSRLILGGYGSHAILGIRTTKQTKSIGCQNTKMLVEKEKVIIKDFDVVDELTNFVQTGDSYAADDSCHDDLVMCLVLFAWASTQDHFKQNYDQDIRQRIEEEAALREEAELMPFGFIESSAYETYDDIDYTSVVEARGYDPTF
jgi:hypothetical protein